MTRTHQTTQSLDETLYILNPGQAQSPGWAPYSAVSSFNIPLQYDSSFISPVSIHDASPLPMKDGLMMRNPDLLLSPNAFPLSHLASPDDMYVSNDNSPMKYQECSGYPPFLAADFFPPGSPIACPSPYYGLLSVSATLSSTRTSNSSPRFDSSPAVQSAGGYGNGDYTRNETPVPNESASTYRNRKTSVRIAPNPASSPVLIAPNPATHRSATTSDGGQCYQGYFLSYTQVRRHSMPDRRHVSRESSPTSSKSEKKSLKRKSSLEQYEQLIACNDVTEEERLLLRMSVRDNAPWKEIVAKYNEAFKDKPVQTAALQMRKRRLLDRLVFWTAEEETALILSHQEHQQEHKSEQWSQIAKDMRKHGSKQRWSTEAVRSKWAEIHSEKQTMTRLLDGQHPRRRTLPNDRDSVAYEQRSWSDDGSAGQSLYEDESGTLIAALSSASMDDAQGRRFSDAGVQMQMVLSSQHSSSSSSRQQHMYGQCKEQHERQVRY